MRQEEKVLSAVQLLINRSDGDSSELYYLTGRTRDRLQHLQKCAAFQMQTSSSPGSQHLITFTARRYSEGLRTVLRGTEDERRQQHHEID